MKLVHICLCSTLLIGALCSSFMGAARANPSSGKPPARPKPNASPAYALGPPVAIAVVTDKDNGSSVTLPPDTILIVRLRAALPMHTAWNLLLPPDLPLRLSMPPRRDRAIDEFRFAPHYLPGKAQTFFLRFVDVDTQLPATSKPHFWQIHVTIPAAFVETIHTLPLSPHSSFH